MKRQVCKPSLLFNIFIFLITVSPPSVWAQEPSFGGGIGLNVLRFDNPRQSPNARLANPEKVFSSPQISMNIDYCLPDRLPNKFLGKLYNPIFDNPFLQLRTQLIINQFRVSELKNYSISTLGGSLLYFPVPYHQNNKANFFVEVGYKACWNNTIIDPFNSMVIGMGIRAKMGNDWHWQINLNHTFAFYDYLDHTGEKGLSFKGNDGFTLINFSLIKSFYSRDAQKRMDEARDSFAMSKGFAFSAIQKVTKITENLKTIRTMIQAANTKVDSHRIVAEKLAESARFLSAKTNAIRSNLPKIKSLDKAKQGLDTLKSQYSFVDVRNLVESGKATTQLFAPNIYEMKYADMLRDMDDARKNLKNAQEFMPKAEELEREVKKSPTLAKATRVVTAIERDITDLKKRIAENQAKIKTALAAFEKANTEVKRSLEDIGKLEKEILAAKN